MKRQQHFSEIVDFQDQKDEYEDYEGFVWNDPKRSSIRRKKRFRAQEFVPGMNFRSRRKHNRQSIRTDAKFWEV